MSLPKLPVCALDGTRTSLDPAGEERVVLKKVVAAPLDRTSALLCEKRVSRPLDRTSAAENNVLDVINNLEVGFFIISCLYRV
jgi:hypothetical protein